jgi:RNA polymerase sigma-70 factor (ECF subfamily)
LLKWQRDRAHATAFRILQQSADADDAVQQAFLKLLSRTQGFDNADVFRIAVYRSVVQCALDMARAKRVHARLEKAMSRLETVRFSANPSPALRSEDKEALAAAWDEMQALSEEQRAMVVLCCQEGLSISDASEVLSMPRETLRDRLKGALEELRSRLGARGITASLLLLTALLPHGTAIAAPATLCESLDVLLPGAPCTSIQAARPSAASASGDVTQALSEGLRVQAPPTSAFRLWRPIAAAAVLMLCAGAVWLGTRTSTDAETGRGERVAPATKMLATSTPTLTVVTPAQGKTAAEEKPNAPRPAQAAGRALKKDEILLTDVPPELLAAAGRSLPGFTLLEAERKMEGGKLIYELKGRSAAGVYEITLTPDGRVLEVERDDDEIEAAAKSIEKKKVVPNPGDF